MEVEFIGNATAQGFDGNNGNATVNRKFSIGEIYPVTVFPNAYSIMIDNVEFQFSKKAMGTIFQELTITDKITEAATKPVCCVVKIAIIGAVAIAILTALYFFSRSK